MVYWICGIILAFNLIRFAGLDQAPPGFFVDEAVAALNALCIAQTGGDYSGQRLPVMAVSEFYGAVNGPWLYLGALWSSMFGSAPADFRALAAFFTVLTVGALSFLARDLHSRSAALWTAVTATLSPWAFQFSRIAWDPPLGPFFIVVAVYLFFCRRGLLALVLSALALALAAYSYQAFRVTAILMAAGIIPLALMLRRRSAEECIILLLLSGLFVLPLIHAMTSPESMSRFESVSIMSSTYLGNRGGGPWLLTLLGTFASHFAQHFSPSYLFISGDRNLRHSTQAIGQLSPLDALGLLFGLIVLLRSIRRGGWEVRSSPLMIVTAISLIGIGAGVTPAALTWESIPHSLRSIGAWPFFALLSGVLLAEGTARWPLARWLVLTVATIYAALFTDRYFSEYPGLSHLWFHADVIERAEAARSDEDWTALLRDMPKYHISGGRYLLMHYRGSSCSESQRLLDSLLKAPAGQGGSSVPNPSG